MTVEELLQELELTLSDICFSGLQNAQPALLNKLDALCGWMEELGMRQGCLLLGAFQQSLRGYRLGEKSARTAVDKLCALEFYCRNVTENRRLKVESRS